MVLTQSLGALVPSSDAFTALRRRVCQQMALSSFLCRVLGVGDRALHKILISLSTGDVVNADFRPSFSSPKGLLHNPDAVPFRLTRNFQVGALRGAFREGLGE